MDAGDGYKASYIWKSLIEGRRLVQRRLCFLVGNGREINNFSDQWLPTNPLRCPQPRECMKTDLQSVHELLIPGIQP